MENKPLFPSELPEAETGAVRGEWVRYFEVAFRMQMLDPDVAYSKWQNAKPQGWIKFTVENVLAPASDLREMIAIAQRQESVHPYFNKISKEKRLQVISQVILFDLLHHGFFIKEPAFESKRYYFHEKLKEVFSIKEGVRFDPVFESYLCMEYNLLMNMETILKFIYSYAMNTYEERELFRYFHYDKKEEVLYVFNREREYYQLDGERITKHPNGRHLLFKKESNNKRIDYIPLEERINPQLEIKGVIKKPKGDYLSQLFIERTNFDPNTNLSFQEQQAQLTLYFYTFPFADLLHTKPIMALVGDRGSGKTFTIETIGRFLIKENFAVRILDDKEALIVAIANNLLVVLDNVDKFKPWLQDIINSFATGAAIARRELYKTLDELERIPSCFIVLTSRQPYFKREDTADRLLLFHCARISNFIDEEVLLSDIFDNRNFLWSLYIDDLNEIVKTLRDTSLRCFQTTHRLADWTKLAYIINSALKVSETYEIDFMVFLQNMDHERAAFQFNNSILLPLLKQYAEEHSNKWVTASEILEVIKSYDDSVDLSTKSLGQTLSRRQPALNTLVGMEVYKDSHGRLKKYRFINGVSRKESEPAITLEGFIKDGEMRKYPLYDLSREEGGVFINPPLGSKEVLPYPIHHPDFSMKDLIDHSFNNYDGKPIELDKILDAGELLGFNRKGFVLYIDNEVREGRLFEPKPGETIQRP